MRNCTVLLIDHDSVRHNLALMKLSSYYKKLGCNVLFNMPLFPADKVFISKLFTFSPDVTYPGECKVGGPGSGNNLFLSDPAEDSFPDYSLYDIDYSLGYTSRGCPNRCGFCCIPVREGAPMATGDIYSFWDKRHRNITIMDSNILFDFDHFKRIVDQLKKEDLIVRFEQGLDIRRIDEDVSKILSGVKFLKHNISWDSKHIEYRLKHNVKALLKYISHQRVGVHILVGYDTDVEYDYYRIQEVKGMGLTPFVMVYDKRRDSSILTMLAGWANSRHITNLPFNKYMAHKQSLNILYSSPLSYLCK